MKRRIIRVRAIMAAVNCSPAVASRRAKYSDDFRVKILVGAQPIDIFFQKLFLACGAAQVVERGAQAVARGGACCASPVLDRGA
jgi:hypothetical protein